MKNYISKIGLSLLATAALSACSKFEDVNTSPTAANADQVLIEYFLNGSITGAQMNPDVAERSFVLYWKTAARQHFTTGIAGGTYDDSWSNVYWDQISKWLNGANTGIQIAEEQKAKGAGKEYTDNLIQVSRIWRAYLLSEAADMFGPLPIEAFQGVNPEFNSVKDVYYYMLAELKDASEKLNPAIKIPGDIEKFDRAYKFDFDKWQKYANSMRMRLAMRLSEVDPAKAKEEFEAAVASNKFISNTEDNFTVKEESGWNDLTGVMSREWNSQVLSATMNNMYTGLGGIKSQDQLAASYHSAIKDNDYIGLKFDKHYSSMTNDPSAGFWMDGLPNTIDPRAYKTFFIPGDFSSETFSNFPAYTTDAITTKTKMVIGRDDDDKEAIAAGEKDDILLDAKNTWNSFAIGDWGAKGVLNKARTILVGKAPGLSKEFRLNTSSRIFFANWETHFLLAEAALKGWNTGTTAQTAYENGVKANFEYWKVGQYASQYLASESFNRVGTSAKFNHTAEPGSSHSMTYKDGYTGATGTVDINYPINNLYKNGSFKNDQLTKIITQKYLANMPWLPMEAWNDQRRLGLPFFENPAIENTLTNLPDLNSGNYKTSNVKFFPQRVPYPSSLRESDGVGYAKATELLGGRDAVLTPLWWAKQN